MLTTTLPARKKFFVAHRLRWWPNTQNIGRGGGLNEEEFASRPIRAKCIIPGPRKGPFLGSRRLGGKTLRKGYLMPQKRLKMIYNTNCFSRNFFQKCCTKNSAVRFFLTRHSLTCGARRWGSSSKISVSASCFTKVDSNHFHIDTTIVSGG